MHHKSNCANFPTVPAPSSSLNRDFAPASHR
jgi:hypothetical protein